MRITIWDGCVLVMEFEVDPAGGSVDIDPRNKLAYQKSKDGPLRWVVNNYEV